MYTLTRPSSFMLPGDADFVVCCCFMQKTNVKTMFPELAGSKYMRLYKPKVLDIKFTCQMAVWQLGGSALYFLE